MILPIQYPFVIRGGSIRSRFWPGGRGSLSAHVNPLESTLVNSLVSVENERLTETLSILESTASKITALVLGWVENSVFLSDSRGFGVAEASSKCGVASIVW